jgi:hypothetical protein
MRGTILMFLSASRASAFMPAARGFLGRTAGMRAAPAAIRVYSSVDDASPEAPPPVAEAAAPAEAAEAPAPAPAGGNDEDASKVYVGNLSFQTSDAELYVASTLLLLLLLLPLLLLPLLAPLLLTD